MGIVIFWGILVILIAFIMGAILNMLIDSSDTLAEGLFPLAIGTLLFAICGTGFIFTNQKCFEKKEYSTTEYRLNRSIITVNKNNTVKVDTLYSLEKRK